MNRSISRIFTLVFVIALILVVFLYNGNSASAEPPPPSTNSQEIIDNEPDGPLPYTDSQGNEALPPAAPGVPFDELSPLAPDATAFFYHIPGSTLTPVDSTTKLSYDLMGCIHATAGATYLLNAPLEVPNGSRIVLLRLYYDDTSTTQDVYGWITRYNEAGTDFEDLVAVPSNSSSGHGSNFGDLDHVVNTYSYSYVLVARVNVASTALQVCGLRVMYYLH
jgi:hypothetical protein